MGVRGKLHFSGPMYHRDKLSRYQLSRMLGGFQGRVGRFGEEINFLPLPMTGRPYRLSYTCSHLHVVSEWNAVARFKKGARWAVRSSGYCGHWNVKHALRDSGHSVGEPQSWKSHRPRVSLYAHWLCLTLSCTPALCFALSSPTATSLFFRLLVERCFISCVHFTTLAAGNVWKVGVVDWKRKHFFIPKFERHFQNTS
jgi:hypothetical protein